MVRNVAARMVFSRRLWRNDPDCLILRDAGAEFSLEQATCLATVAALSAGALIFSDRPDDLLAPASAPRLAVLQVCVWHARARTPHTCHVHPHMCIA